ncbi:anti-sigma factor [Vallicoccus soli]|uniref:anti-sigma factor n=1 Tax=Vallicoccus soli TaxID=2339232 RepID=UPI001C49C347|nr:anti-sigma factor [Vallicoccus soli]
MSSELHTLTGAYALHALPPDEEAEFERHLRECDDCRQEVRELEATTAQLGAAAAVTPPPELKRRVMAHVATTRQEPPRSSAARSAAHRRWWAQPAGIAAAVLLAVSVGLGGVALDQRSDLSEARAQQQAVAAVLADPDRRIATAALGTATGTVVVADDRAVFLASDLEDLPEDRTYQLWTLRDDGTDIRSAGLLEAQDGTTQSLVEDLDGTEALAVSVEPAGGSEQPTADQILGAVPLA